MTIIITQTQDKTPLAPARIGDSASNIIHNPTTAIIASITMDALSITLRQLIVLSLMLLTEVRSDHQFPLMGP